MTVAGSRPEQAWIQAARTFVRETQASADGLSSDQLSELVINCVRASWRPQGATGDLTLPLSYSFVSVRELRSRQRQPCCSHLAWSSSEYRQWAERPPAEGTPLPRARLLLLGTLTDRSREAQRRTGSLYVTDNSGALLCELLHLDLSWLGRLLLFPSWSFLPPPRGDPRGGGHLELWGAPVPVLPPDPSPASGPATRVPVLYPQRAARLLRARRSWVRRQRLNLAGELARLSALLDPHGTPFFFLTLRGPDPAAVSIPVVVQAPAQLVWYHALQPGHSYMLTEMRVGSFRTSPHRVWVAGPRSRLLPLHPEHVREQDPGEPPPGDAPESPPRPSSPPGSPPGKARPGGLLMESRMLSYTGTITRVLDAAAGLYELDYQLCLCLAYQPGGGRALRPGTSLELQDVHLFQASASGPLAKPVLAPCFRGGIWLRGFSRRGSGTRAPPGTLHLQLLLKRGLGLPLYLWLAQALEELANKFCPRLLRLHQLHWADSGTPGLGERLLGPILDPLASHGGPARDLHREILDEPHRCPLQEYSPLQPPCSFPSLANLREEGERRAWATFDPTALLPPTEAAHLTSCQLNCSLAWSWLRLLPADFHPPPVLLGILHPSSRLGQLRLWDQSGLLPCVALPGPSQPLTDPRLAGSLVQVKRFQLVVEREIQSNFPSWKELGTPGFIQKQRCRVYVQFYLDDALIVPLPGPSPGPAGAVGPPQAKCRCPEGPGPRLSRLFLLTSKEALMERNYLPRPGDGPACSHPAFSFHAAGRWLGGGQQREGDTRGPPEPPEGDDRSRKVLLLFLGPSVRWFEFLHPGQVYRLVEPSPSAPELLEGGSTSLLSRRTLELAGCASCLTVQDNWSLEPGDPQDGPGALAEREEGPMESSLMEIFSGSPSESLVSFSAEIGSRTRCEPPLHPLRRGHGGPRAQVDNVKLTVWPFPGGPSFPTPLDVYLEMPHSVLPLGLLPGARVLFLRLQRKVSRSHNVYCRFLSSSSLRVLSFPAETGSSPPPLPPPLVFLAELPGSLPGVPRARTSCHVVSVFSLQIRWVCSHCVSLCPQGQCSRTGPPCPTPAAVCQAFARLLVEDGTAEAVVTCKDHQVAEALGLDPPQWQALQEMVRGPGKVAVQPAGPGARPEHTGEAPDGLSLYLQSLCTSPVVLRPVQLTFQLARRPPGGAQPDSPRLQRFQCRELPVHTWVGPRLHLTCVSLREPEAPTQP
ncbi:CST complex subunit CTC1 [Tachyglossus aculeatus]|uniref:CST complex subunit CTC1 n=1 Tax=Tachyglossus aculeatus TaxID=9261 RepID=UPI0018F6611B|nr:CST complex subunit CTC1 [Tachyglossus aculeatus]